jgi:hypothetical protein
LSLAHARCEGHEGEPALRCPPDRDEARFQGRVLIVGDDQGLGVADNKFDLRDRKAALLAFQPVAGMPIETVRLNLRNGK